MNIDSRQPLTWIDVSPRKFSRAQFAPYTGGDISHLFDWGENPNGASSHIMPYRGQMIVDIVEIEANAVHQPNKPGDEIVVVVRGTLVLTTDANKQEQVIKAGEAVLIPAGWSGLYRVVPDAQAFLEFTIVPQHYFDVPVRTSPNSLTPRPIEYPSATGEQIFHSGCYTLQVENRPLPHTWRITNQADEIIYIQSGELTLGAGDRKMSFGPGDAVVLPAGLTCQALATSGYRAFTARWLA